MDEFEKWMRKDYPDESEDAYDTLRELHRPIWQAALKRAAEVCLEQAHGVDYEPHIHFDRGTEACAEAIEREAEGK